VKRVILTKENYHSNEANRVYMSNSQYKDFLSCEAAAMAKIRGEFITPQNDACLIGSYVHAWLEGAIDEFKEQTPELFKNNGQLYAKYEVADRMIETLRSDKLVQYIFQGQKEVIMTAEMFGAPWKVRFDVYQPGKKIVDLKTVQDIRKKIYTPLYGYTSFVEAYEYIRQFAIYLEVERRVTGAEAWLERFLVAVSKEEEPDKEIITIDNERLQIELDLVENNMPRIIAVKSGFEQPKRCEVCKYCRRTKKLTGVVHFSELVVS